MQLFYSKHITDSNPIYALPKDESKHMVRVLRKKEGDVLHITDGKGNLYTAKILMANNSHCEIEILSKKHLKKHDYYLHIAIAPTKNNDRLEWFLEKATEIGIDEISPIICDNSERKKIKHERLSKIVQSAMKQSLQCHLPKLNEAVSFKEFIKNTPKGNLFIAHCEADKLKIELKNKIIPKAQYTLLIGPEGDFSPSEIEMALANNYHPIGLGNTRLRTETAGVVACHTVALLQ